MLHDKGPLSDDSIFTSVISVTLSGLLFFVVVALHIVIIVIFLT